MPQQPPRLSEIHGEEILDTGQTLWDIFSATASSHPDREAVVSLWQTADAGADAGPGQSSADPNPSAGSSCLRWTYRDLWTKAEHLANVLEEMGCAPGMQLAAMLWNSAEWALFFWAAARTGMTFVPIDPRAPDDFTMLLNVINPSLLVVQDVETARALGFGSQDAALSNLICVQCQGEALGGWVHLGNLISESLPPHLQGAVGATGIKTHFSGNVMAYMPDGQKPAMIIFTSGTTGSPKGCLHTNFNLISETHEFDPNADSALVDRWLVHTPVCHVFAANNSLRAWRHGGVVVFAGRSFSVDTTVKALVQERCTIMSATPTLVKALLAHPSLPSPDELSLSIVSFSATMIKPEDIEACRQGLGARDVIQAYGMSEGAPLVSWKRSDMELSSGFHPGVGKVLPGASIRVCHPETTHILPRSQRGELHISGPSVILSYVGDVDNSMFYTDGTKQWLRTGDQAMIDEDDVVHIVGRYKDVIIRGGENISPVRIEKALATMPELGALVIGVTDDVAGQVPVAVVRDLSGTTRARILETSRSLGKQYALDAVYTLSDLGIEDFPVTSIGKPKKGVISDLVSKVRARSTSRLSEPNLKRKEAAELQQTLLDIWDNLTGARPQVTDSIFFLADSIILLRYCDAVLRTCGRQIYLQDLKLHQTVEQQSKLLLTRAIHPVELTNNHIEIQVQDHERTRTLLLSDYSPNSKGREPLKRTSRSSLRDMKALENGSNSMEPIEEHEDRKEESKIPIRHSFHRMLGSQRPQSYHVRVVFRVRNSTSDDVVRAIYRALDCRPTMRTVLSKTNEKRPYHIIIELDELQARDMVQKIDVDTAEAAKEHYESSMPPSQAADLMFQALVIQVSKTGEVLLSLTYNHSIIDALTLLAWHRDLDHLLGNPGVQMPPLTSYKLFADMFAQYQDSSPAKKSASFHVRRLRGISRHQRALWPVQKAPGMMISSDADSEIFKEREKVRNKVWNGKWKARSAEFRFPRRSRVVNLPQLVKLQETHGIKPVVFAKCAIVLFNVLQTGAPVALLKTWEAGRSWPFMPRWVEGTLPPPMSIDGPTAQWILNMFETSDRETVSALFHRIKAESELVDRHVHAPWERVIQGLRDEGDVAIAASFRQAFVWDVSVGVAASPQFRQDFEALDHLARYDWPDCGLYWNAFMTDRTEMCFVASWDTAQMNADEMDAHCDTLATVMRKLAQEENWTRSIGEVFAS